MNDIKDILKMTTMEYINSLGHPNDWITLEKIDNFISTLVNGRSVIAIRGKVEEYRYKYDMIYKFANTYPDLKIILIILSPDRDFPPPKESIICHQDKPLSINQDLQTKLDEMNYYDKIDTDMIFNLPSNIIHIFSTSVGITKTGQPDSLRRYSNKSNMITMFPLGHDFKAIKYHDFIHKLRTDIRCKTGGVRDTLCYYNCTLPPDVVHWYGLVRKYIMDWTSTEAGAFVTVEHCKQNPRPLDDELFHNYFTMLSKSKFMICPRGCGLDTYRMWDCIYMGCIPIVEKFDGYNDMTDLPILFVDSWKDYMNLTVEYLDEQHNIMIMEKWNYDKLKMSYWENLIRERIKSLYNDVNADNSSLANS